MAFVQFFHGDIDPSWIRGEAPLRILDTGSETPVEVWAGTP